MMSDNDNDRNLQEGIEELSRTAPHVYWGGAFLAAMAFLLLLCMTAISGWERWQMLSAAFGTPGAVAALSRDPDYQTHQSIQMMGCLGLSAFAFGPFLFAVADRIERRFKSRRRMRKA
jgi:hypothetical protein